ADCLDDALPCLLWMDAMERRTCTCTLFPFISTVIHFSILLPTTTVLRWHLNDNNKNKLPFQAGSVSRFVFAVRSPVRIVATVRFAVVVVGAFCELALSTRSVLNTFHFSVFHMWLCVVSIASYPPARAAHPFHYLYFVGICV
ncbi:MAG: hypothetical protein ACX936_21090, partial [Marinobacter sp.]